ncbi:uncharacterized protein LOC110990249 [Acanthaster planci]|uniref:Uncharacterized protein LOC110990249 n=1 Tax=Acanthaster planci TaxID=133434 RepID=A0A8B7ZZH3_ACAPL|nr:uncharacterized protein LOC110990249 [Acanthaster planci]
MPKQVGHYMVSQGRQAVEAADCVFLERRILELQCNLVNHSWVSFSGFSESYNGTFKLTRHTGLSARNVSSAFFNAISCHVHLTKKTTLKELMRHKKYGLVSSNQYTQKEILQLEAVGHGHGGDPEDRQQYCSESTLLLPGNCFDCHNSHLQDRLSAFFRNLQFSMCHNVRSL